MLHPGGIFTEADLSGVDSAVTNASLTDESTADDATAATSTGEVTSSAAATLASGGLTADEELAAYKALTSEELYTMVEEAEGSYSEETILVVFEDGAYEESRSELMGVLGATSYDVISDSLGEDGAVVEITIDADMSVADAVVTASETPGVSYAEPNTIYTLSTVSTTDTAVTTFATTVNDPAASSSTLSWWLYSIDAFEAWDYSQVEGDVTIAVIDTGAYFEHEDLQNIYNTKLAYDAVNETKLTTSASSDFNHGVNVAGVAAAEANNDTGIAGASYNASILPIAVFQSTSSGDIVAYGSSLIEAYRYLLEQIDSGNLDNLRVINMSLGSYSELSTTFHQLIAKAQDDYNILTVCAGGNGIDNVAQTDAQYPADWEECISVVAIDSNDERAAWSDYNEYKDLAAPGVSIYTTTIISFLGLFTIDYQTFTGTSAAAPIVSAAAALLFAADSDATVAEVKEALYETAIDLGDEGRDDYYGYGKVNPTDAILYLLSLSDEEDESDTKDDSTISFKEGFSLDKTYDGYAVSVSKDNVTVEGSTGEVTFEFEVKTGDNTWEPIDGAPTDAGIYRVTAYVAADANYGAASSEALEFTISPATPDADDFAFSAPSDTTYDGSEKIATVSVAEGITGMGEVTVYYSSDNGASWNSTAPTDAGTYKVAIRVAEGGNYAATGEGVYLTGDGWEFIISQATNSWTATLSIEGWTYGDAANSPSAEAAFGEVSFTYSTSKDGEYSSDVPTDAGTYYVKASVEGSENYTGLESDPVAFTISQADAGEGEEGDSGTSKSGWTRLAGSDRYGTMVEVVQEAFADGSSTYVVIASGQNFADSLAASSLAGALDAPIILVSGSLTEDTITQITRLGASYAYIVGGAASVSESVANQVASITGIANVERISGDDRYATAVAVAEKTVSLLEDRGKTLSAVILASGTVFADALSISPYAYTTATPIILVGSNGLLDDASAEWIKSSKATSLIVVGGTSSVAAGVITQTGISNTNSERLAGSDRYATSVAIANWAIEEGYLRANGAVVASGATFPDALAASALCGQLGSVLLLAADGSTTATSVISTYADSITYAYFVGGTSSISTTVANTFVSASKISLN